mmetsp:Transcript_13173/g.44637  ORF Transcript_13173/g.44637 Transcript_13173/m.44637 type:complete len:225 (-) Transcript_13173:111-785(-)
MHWRGVSPPSERSRRALELPAAPAHPPHARDPDTHRGGGHQQPRLRRGRSRRPVQRAPRGPRLWCAACSLQAGRRGAARLDRELLAPLRAGLPRAGRGHRVPELRLPARQVDLPRRRHQLVVLWRARLGPRRGGEEDPRAGAAHQGRLRQGGGARGHLHRDPGPVHGGAALPALPRVDHHHGSGQGGGAPERWTAPGALRVLRAGSDAPQLPVGPVANPQPSAR